MRSVRTFEASEAVAYEAPHPAQQEVDLTHDEHPPNTLSPIPEETSVDLDGSTDSLAYMHEDPELTLALLVAMQSDNVSEPREEEQPEAVTTHQDWRNPQLLIPFMFTVGLLPYCIGQLYSRPTVGL